MRNRKTEVHTGQGLYRHENHKKPVTRRDFLAAGLTSGLGIAVGPSLVGLLTGSNDAYAAAGSCGGAVSTGGAGRIPFICFDLAGGSNIAGSNVLVGLKEQTDLLDDAGNRKLGIADSMSPRIDPAQINTSLGLKFHSQSALLAGINFTLARDPVLQALVLANTDGCVICARSNDDTSNNPHNPMYAIGKSGSKGQLVTLIGSSNTVSGGNSVAPPNQIDATMRPTKIATANDTKGLVDTGKLSSLLGSPDSIKVMESIERLSAAKGGKIGDTEIVKGILGCAYSGSTEKASQFSNPFVLSPVGGGTPVIPVDPNVAKVFDVVNGNIADGDFMKTAAIMKLVVQGYAGAGTIQMGGFDYHTGKRGDGDLKDLKAGKAIGAVLAYAAANNKPVMIYVFSDGAVSSNGTPDDAAGGKLVWTSDNGTCAATFFLVYNPTGKPQLANKAGVAQRQLGKYKATGSVDTAAQPFSNNVVQLAEVVALNYLALHGQVGKFGQVVPAQGLGPSTTWDNYAMFAPIVPVV